MHNLFLVYFLILYMFRVYLGPSLGGTTIRIQQLVLFFLDDCLLSCLDLHLNRIISTNCFIYSVVPPDDGPRYTRNM